jgi:hypothetical protein
MSAGCGHAQANGDRMRQTPAHEKEGAPGFIGLLAESQPHRRVFRGIRHHRAHGGIASGLERQEYGAKSSPGCGVRDHFFQSWGYPVGVACDGDGDLGRVAGVPSSVGDGLLG